MPGIVGLITKAPRLQAEAELLRMLATLRHESFYVTGTWVDASLGVYLGWAARQNSFAEKMPLCNEQGSVVLVLAGEEFPAPDLKSRLKQRGHCFEENGPEYVVHLAEEEPNFPRTLNGRFHGLLVDGRARKALLFNDRYGMQRVYYHQGREAFYFAAEAKAILEVRPELRTADSQGMAELISLGCVLENRTVFAGLRLLPAGSAWSFRDGALEGQGAYFQPQEWEGQDTLELEPYYAQLREIFAQNLQRYFDGSQRIGMSLTGGLDSRIIMAWRKAPADSLPCYSFGGMFRDCEDVTTAREVARTCGQRHQVLPLGEEFLTNFPRYSERTVYLTDGCAGVSHSCDLYLNERAREIAPVRMTGNYGGEVLRRIRAFKPVDPEEGLFDEGFSALLARAKQSYAGLLTAHPLSFALFRQAPWHHYSLLALEETQVALRSPYLDNDVVRTVFRSPHKALVNSDLSLRLIEDGNPALRRIPTDRGLAGNHGALASRIRHQYREFTFKAEFAYDYGMPQWLARLDHALSAFQIERRFLGRHKFYHFRVWYRDALAKYVQDMLLDPRTLCRPYLRRNIVEEIVRGHVAGNRNYTLAIHKLLTIEHLHRLFLDPK